MAEQKNPWDDFLSGSFFEKLKLRQHEAVKSGDGDGKAGQGGMSNRSKIVIAVVAVTLVIIILSASGLATFFTDYLWFDEVGQTGVFWKVISTKIWVFFLFAFIFFVIFYLNIFIAKRMTPKYELGTVTDQPPGPGSVPNSVTKRASGWGAACWRPPLLISLGVGWAVARQWEKVLKFFTYTSVGKTDPIFSNDIGFYLFRLPFLEYFFSWLFTVLIATLIVTAAVHFLYGAINFNKKNQRFAGHAKAHLSVLAGLILLVQACRFRLQMFNTLFHTQGNFTGAHYSDVHALIPALWILIFVSFACAVLFIINIHLQGVEAAGRRAGPDRGDLGTGGGALSLHHPDLRGQAQGTGPRERVHRVQHREHPERLQPAERRARRHGHGNGVPGQPGPDLRRHPGQPDHGAQHPPVGPVSLRSRCSLQRQVLRQEYSFTDTDVDRYTVGDGTYNQMLLSGRELVYGQLPPSARSWQNEHLSYTHGYSTVMAPEQRL